MNPNKQHYTVWSQASIYKEILNKSNLSLTIPWKNADLLKMKLFWFITILNILHCLLRFPNSKWIITGYLLSIHNQNFDDSLNFLLNLRNIFVMMFLKLDHRLLKCFLLLFCYECYGIHGLFFRFFLVWDSCVKTGLCIKRCTVFTLTVSKTQTHIVCWQSLCSMDIWDIRPPLVGFDGGRTRM